MDYFNYKNDELYAEDVPVSKIAASYGTPTFIYSRATIERHWRAFDHAFKDQPHLVCYAVKANSNLAVLNILARMGSGFDIVSGGELQRVLAAGGSPKKIVFSGVGKTKKEIELALKAGIRCFNVESRAELDLLEHIASSLSCIAPISIRVNPDVDANTHPYISTGLKQNKFGVDTAEALKLYQQAKQMSHINIEGIDCHIGSQLTEISPFLDALEQVLILIEKLRKLDIRINHLDIGGGLGICYQNESPPEPAEYAQAIMSKLNKKDLEIIIEPGRAIMGNAGILITKVEYIKSNSDKNFAIVDAAMNDLIRPALYQSWQNIIPVNKNPKIEAATYDIVGPVCETGDFLGKQRKLAIQAGSMLAVLSSGAYGFVMSSNYNTRARAAEIIVDKNHIHLVRKRESIESLFELESIIPESYL